jgi:hypothetical protein
MKNKSKAIEQHLLAGMVYFFAKHIVQFQGFW